MLQNVCFTAFIFSDLLKENKHGEEGFTITRPTLIGIHPDEAHYYSLLVRLDRCEKSASNFRKCN